MREVAVDVKLISATHQCLETLMEAGDFRADLFYRLNILPCVAPLRDRREDIFPLVQFICKFNVQHKRDIQTIEEQALMSLRVSMA